MKKDVRRVRLNIKEMEKILDFVRNNCEKHVSVDVVERNFSNGLCSDITIEAPVVLAGNSGVFVYKITDECDF